MSTREELTTCLKLASEVEASTSLGKEFHIDIVLGKEFIKPFE